NPRNAAAGSLRTLVPLQNRNLHFFAYQLFNSNLPSQLSCLQELEKLGFAVSPDYRLFRNIEEVEKFIQQQEKKRESLDFESDGVVVKVNDYKHYEKLGQTSRFPRWAIAYKFPASLAVSQVQNIYVEVSRNGRITYVAEIIPVILQGSKISKVTLHNYAFIANLELNIDIKGISTKNIQKLYENNLLNQPADFYRLYQKERQLLKLEGFRKKKNSKKRPLDNLLTALGIPLLSSVKAQKLTKFYPNLTKKFREILGEETQKELKKYLSEPKNLSLLEEMKLINEVNNSPLS
ncbi:11133_t:CDS:2, partial [Racocetra fulgida]